MNKKILWLLCCVLFSGFAFGQVSANPDHEFYVQLDRWESLGIVSQQSLVRPYPLGKVEAILNSVAECENEVEAQRAQLLYEEIFNKPWKLVFDLNGSYRAGSESNTKSAFAVLGIDGDAKIYDGISAGYKMDALAGKNYFPIVAPSYIQSPYTLSDSSTVAGITGCLDCDGSFAYENGNFSVQSGINHISFGLFLNDGIAISNNARHTANLVIGYNNGFINYSEGMMALCYNTEGHLVPNKYLMFHSISLNPIKSLSLTFYELSIFGGRFDPSYLIPMPYLVTEGVTGFDEDNVFMGGSLAFRPIRGLTWKIDGLLDDFSITGWKLYHDIRLRLSGRTSIEYVPSNLPWFESVSVDYTLVTPYMYTHIVDYGPHHPKSDINYQVYINGDRHLATVLEPNSDRIMLKAAFAPLKNLKVGVGGTFIRHANVNENLIMADKLDYIRSEYGFQNTDGSVNNHGLVPGERRFSTPAWYQINFMVQDTIEYTFQANLNAVYDLPKMSFGSLAIGFDYTFEFIKNHGVSNDIFTYYLREGETSTSNTRNEYSEDDVEDAINKWKENLSDITNHYFTLKFIYRF